MNQKDVEIARGLKKRLSAIVRLLDFRVFGSRARGEHDENSDMDVFIEVENLDKGLKKAIRDVVWEVGFENSIYISPLIYTRSELVDTPIRSSPIVLNIHDEGVQI
jgi:predicted nucleotidyltransferase